MTQGWSDRQAGREKITAEVGVTVVFRADASIEIGSGHVMRCLALASALADAGAKVLFISRDAPGGLLDAIESRWGFEVQRLRGEAAWDKDAAETGELVSSKYGHADWLVVDHYALDSRWECQARAYAANIMVMSDLADRAHDCDLLVDQNLQSRHGRSYDAFVPLHARRLIGPRYALLRPEFQHARSTLRPRDGSVRRVLIFFGGIDLSNETAKALAAVGLLGSRRDIAVDVIIGAACPHAGDIRAMASALPWACMHFDPQSIAELMARADVAIGAAGASSWERCCVGLPAIVVTLAPNQEAVACALAENGLAVHLGRSEDVSADGFRDALEALIADAPRVAAMAQACAGVTDGNGSTRVALALDACLVTLREARIEDCESLYAWRNDPLTRAYFHDPRPITMTVHREWLMGVLQDENRSLLIGQRNERPIGVLRYDCVGADCLASIYLVPGEQRRGYGSRLLCTGHDWLRRHRPKVRCVRAEILEENVASVRAFLQAGYARVEGGYSRRIG